MAGIPFWFSSAAFAAAVLALGFAGVLLKRRSNSFYCNLAVVLGVSGLIQVANGMNGLDASHALMWRRVALLGELAQPAVLLLVVSALIREISGSIGATDLWRAWAVTLVAGVFATLSFSDEVLRSAMSEGGISLVVLGSLGRVAYAFILVALVVGLAQIEQILRVTRDPVRWQLKFVLIGLGGLAGNEVYQASQLLLIPAWRVEHAVVGGLATLISVGLIAYGLGRRRLLDIKTKVYISPQFVYGSVTFIAVGLYLVAVGLIAQVFRLTGGVAAVGLSSLVAFVAAVGLVVVLSSRQTRAELRRYIARNFYRSKYDYRAKWLEVTAVFRAAGSVEAILDRLIELLGRTFGAARITLWMRCEADGRFHQVRSANTEPAPQPLTASHPVIARLLRTDAPVEVDRATDEDSSPEGASPSRPDPFLAATQAVLCVPIRSANELIAFVALSCDLHGERYGTDDEDLLRAIAYHVAMLLTHVRLAEERRGAAELEALHRFSAFCLHDLKNLAARLSLVVQNAEGHGDDPAFWESTMRTVASTVKKMMTLMTKLSLKVAHPGVPEPVDVQEVIAETVGSLNGALPLPIETAGERVPPVLIVREQLQQVLLNVILNAGQAIRANGAHAGAPSGAVQITTQHVNGFVVVTVADTGPGIEPEELRTLFQPFRTTKEGGLGIGLFQCKRILEAHRGTIHIESEVGRGTRVRIELPVASSTGPSIASSTRRGNHAKDSHS
jgi:putative PEP-CTERM system histidine kinase